MFIGMIGLIVLALFSNIGYYEYMHFKKPKKDKDLLPGYLVLSWKRKKKIVGTFNNVGDSDTKPGSGQVEDFNAR